MLDTVASGKRLLEKNLIVLGGTPSVQREFLETLASDSPRRTTQDRQKKAPPIANSYALGYTYQDVLDADHEDILARLSIYLISDPSPAFAPLLKPLFTAKAIPESMLLILLDWNEPWTWARTLKRWISMLRSIATQLDNETEEVAEWVMKEWQQRKRGPSTYDVGATTNSGGDASVTLPLGEGEWDIPLGLPLCVVCHNADKIPAMEIEHNWREEDFDFVLQFLRTVLLKHGASLIYTSNSSPNSLPTLIHSSLGIQSTLQKRAPKHNVIDRDKVLIPPNWDSFGKIRVLREGFDVEKVSEGWPSEISRDFTPESAHLLPAEGSVLALYETTIEDPHSSSSTNTTLPSSSPQATKPTLEISTLTIQAFLTTQLPILERLKATEDQEKAQAPPDTTARPSWGAKPDRQIDEQIGPVQVNMGGIQVDAEDMLRKLKSQQHNSTSSESGGGGGGGEGSGSGDAALASPSPAASGAAAAGAVATPEREMKAQNEALNNFFTGLMKRGASGSPRNTPGQEGKRGTPKKREEEGGRRLFSPKE